MTADPLTAALDQLAAHREHLSQLDAREAGHFAVVSERIAEVAGLITTMGRTLADDTAALARLDALDRQVAELAAQLGGPGADGEDRYQPGPVPAWWTLTPAERKPAVAGLRAWVEQVYRPGYGHLAAALGPCWERHDGGTYRAIAAAAGLAPATVHDLASGRRQSTPATERALSKVTSGTLYRARLDAGGTRLRLRALHVMGHGSARIARALGVREMTIRSIVRGDATTISPRLRDAVIDLYDAWWDKRAPERTRAERGAATAARRRAVAGNWCAAAGLDDDELDTPGYRPASGWKHATGTGVAPDTRPPARPRKNERP